MPRRLIFVMVLLVTLVFGFRPFNFVLPNDVAFDPRSKSLRFHSGYEHSDYPDRGIAFTDDIFDFREWEEISIAFEVQKDRNSFDIAVIANLVDGRRPPPLVVAQWSDHLVIRSRRPASQLTRGYAEIGVRDVFKDSEFASILLASTQDGTAVYVNSQPAQMEPGFRLLDPVEPVEARLIIGNSAFGEQPLIGSIRQLAIYDRAVNPASLVQSGVAPVSRYDFSKPPGPVARNEQSDVHHLRVPERFQAFDREFLGAIDFTIAGRPGYLTDVLVNLFGFMPIGACFAFASRRLAKSATGWAAWGLLFSFLLSLMIELGQGFLVTRHSSQQDLWLNTIGGGLAALAVVALVPRFGGRASLLWRSFLAR